MERGLKRLEAESEPGLFSSDRETVGFQSEFESVAKKGWEVPVDLRFTDVV